MRRHSIFYDQKAFGVSEKLFHDLHTSVEQLEISLHKPLLTLQMPGGIKKKPLPCSIVPNLPIGNLLTLGSKKEKKKTEYRVAAQPKVSASVVLTFASVEKANLNHTFKIFQKYLGYLKNKLLNSYHSKVKYGLSQTNGYCDVFNLGYYKFTNTLFYKAISPSSPLRNKKIPLNQYLKEYKLKVELLKTLGSLNLPKNAVVDIPQKAQLYTVIRSPHVFKKTREQLNSQKYKRVVRLHLTTTTALRLFMDTLILLRLPVEVKVVASNK
jgi:small subunit ribosomal protein S10